MLTLRGIKGRKGRKKHTNYTPLTLNLTKASNFTLDIELFPPLWGCGMRRGQLLVKFLPFYGASTPSRGTRNTFQFTNEVVLGCAPLFQTSTLAVCTTGSKSRSREHTRLSLIAALPLGLTAFARKFHFLDFRAAAGHLESLLQMMCLCHCTGTKHCASCNLCWKEGRRVGLLVLSWLAAQLDIL